MLRDDFYDKTSVDVAPAYLFQNLSKDRCCILIESVATLHIW